jgi:hypothetical protein
MGDESFQNMRGAKAMAQAMPWIRKISPETRIYQVAWHAKHTRGHSHTKWYLDEEGKKKGTWGEYHVICTNCPNFSDMKLAQSKGAEYWVYSYVCSHVAPTRVRNAYGLNPYRFRSPVMYAWANYWGGTGLGGFLAAPWSINISFYNRRGDYKGNDVLASVVSGAIREGIDDRKYLETLHFWVDKHGNDEDKKFLETISKSVIESIKTNIGGKDNFIVDPKDPERAGKIRKVVAERIKQIVKRAK